MRAERTYRWGPREREAFDWRRRGLASSRRPPGAVRARIRRRRCVGPQACGSASLWRSRSVSVRSTPLADRRKARVGRAAQMSETQDLPRWLSPTAETRSPRWAVDANSVGNQGIAPPQRTTALPCCNQTAIPALQRLAPDTRLRSGGQRLVDMTCENRSLYGPLRALLIGRFARYSLARFAGRS